MSPDDAVRARPLTTELSTRDSPLWWGVALFLTIEAVAFGTLISAYFYLRFHAPEWPPHGAPLPELRYAGAATAALLMSSGSVWLGGRSVDRGGRSLAIVAALAAAILAAIAAGLLTIDRIVDPVRWDRDAYGSVVWTTVVAFALHALVLTTAGGMLAALVRAGSIDIGKRLRYDVTALFWHGIVALWIPLFVVFYLLPRWL